MRYFLATLTLLVALAGPPRALPFGSYCVEDGVPDAECRVWCVPIIQVNAKRDPVFCSLQIVVPRSEQKTII